MTQRNAGYRTPSALIDNALPKESLLLQLIIFNFRDHLTDLMQLKSPFLVLSHIYTVTV